MKAIWILFDNHLALNNNQSIYHPDANEIYTRLVNGNSENTMGLKCSDPMEDMPQLRFSKIGSPAIISISYKKEGSIHLEVIARRNSEIIPVDIINGHLIDHCVHNDLWFYLSGNKVEIQEILETANVLSNGTITMRQYLKIIEQEFLRGINVVENHINSSDFQPSIIYDNEIPITLKANLFPYQKTGFQWLSYMLEDSRGCILGDEMGLGKTMQVIAEMLYLKHNGNTPMMVIAPISLLINWQRECAKFAPTLKTIVHYGQDRISNYRDFYKYDVIITSYTTVVSDVHMMKMIKWKLVTLDEAQNIKNPNSIRTKACKSLNGDRCLAVSGTPFENHVIDIWSIIDFVQPGLLGSLQSYSNAISDDVDGGKKIEPILTPLMIRRLVVDVAKDLPEKVITTQPLQMSEFECEEYNKYLLQLKETCDIEKINLGILQKLRIFCTHPYASTGLLEDGDPAQISIKYQRCCEIIEEILSRNEKVLVFTSYKKMFQIFQKDIPNRFGVELWTINGETPVEERQRIVDKFNNINSSAILILNPRAAGTGLNITGANHIIHYNLEWNPSLEDQASARAYRRGQQKTVFVYRLYYTGTIEQVINERIERKRNIASYAIIGNDGQNQDRADIIRAMELIPSIRIN